MEKCELAEVAHVFQVDNYAEAARGTFYANRILSALAKNNEGHVLEIVSSYERSKNYYVASVKSASSLWLIVIRSDKLAPAKSRSRTPCHVAHKHE